MQLNGELLRKHTTLQMGGPAKEFMIPKNRQELISTVQHYRKHRKEYRILGNGSNIIVNDRGVSCAVIKNTDALKTYELNKAEDIITVGSSVMLIEFVKKNILNSLEGLEYLCTIPGTVGGAIYMNAGRGKKHNCAISDRLVSVVVFDGHNEFQLDKDEMSFGFRRSVFQRHKDWLILEAQFKLRKQSHSVGVKKVKERTRYFYTSPKTRFPSAGSIYAEYSPQALKIMRGIMLGGCKFHGNWISNIRNGRANDVFRLLALSKLLHIIFNVRPSLEVEIW